MATEEDVSALVDERLDKLSISATTDDDDKDKIDDKIDETVTCENANENGDTKIREPRIWDFETRELYKLALNFYKGECRGFFVYRGFSFWIHRISSVTSRHTCVSVCVVYCGAIIT